jgi:hypothetical protein
VRPLFTVHAGEYLAGERLEQKFPSCEIWVPAKDTGTDLLVTNKEDRRKNAGVQVKYSKDFLPGTKKIFQQGLIAQSWFNLPPPEKIRGSAADIWILAPYSFEERKLYCVVLTPGELANRLEKLGHRDKLYLWITRNKEQCFASRGLPQKDQQRIAKGDYGDLLRTARDFSPWLEDWSILGSLLSGAIRPAPSGPPPGRL